MKSVETALNDVLRAAGYMPLSIHDDAVQSLLRDAMRAIQHDAYCAGGDSAYKALNTGGKP